MKIAIIPARGGSKRIPRKNIKEFAGKPMISYAITAAADSGLFDHVVVTTDDDEISQIAEKYGARVPFKRPSELADDYTPTVPVIAHAIEVCAQMGWEIDLACCIYPAVPFIRIEDLCHTLELLQYSEADYGFPVTKFPSAIQKALKLTENHRVSPFWLEHELARTQDIEPAYHDAGQFYWGSRQAWLSNPYIHRSGVGHLIPAWRVVDIDTPDDWMRAELFYHSITRSI